MDGTIHELREGQRYIVGDAEIVLPQLDSDAALIYLDDAWARPQRAEWFGVEYDTHPFSTDEESDYEGVTTIDIIDVCYDALSEGGWLIADSDDWLLPRLITYLQAEWGDVAATYEGGGYRRVGGITYLTQSGEPDRSTPGMYLANGGYSVVFAHRGETERRTTVSARQVTERASFDGDWGSVKPIAPYRAWIEGLMDAHEHLVVPCAGTAPAAIAAEQIFGSDVRYTCIDNSPAAFEAFVERRNQVCDTGQEGMSEFDHK